MNDLNWSPLLFSAPAIFPVIARCVSKIVSTREPSKGALDCISLRMAVALRDSDRAVTRNSRQRESVATALGKHR
jgi:hypothetical protein